MLIRMPGPLSDLGSNSGPGTFSRTFDHHGHRFRGTQPILSRVAVIQGLPRLHCGGATTERGSLWSMLVESLTIDCRSVNRSGGRRIHDRMVLGHA